MYVRFPVRLFWSALLGMSALAALGGWTLQRRLGGSVGLLAGVVVLEAMVIHHLPTRQQVQIAQTPAVYAQATGPVLDLYPQGGGGRMELEMWFNPAACLAQTEHGHVSTERCTTETRTGPRFRISRRLEDDLLEGRPREASRHLAELGCTWPGMCTCSAPRTRSAWRLGWRRSPRSKSVDGGERLLFYTLKQAPKGDPAQA